MAAASLGNARIESDHIHKELQLVKRLGSRARRMAVIPHVTGSAITGESRYPLTRITIVGERIDATPALEWVPAFAGTTDYHIHEYSNAVGPPQGEGECMARQWNCAAP